MLRRRAFAWSSAERDSPRSNTRRPRITFVIFLEPRTPNAALTTWDAWQTARHPPSPWSRLFSRVHNIPTGHLDAMQLQLKQPVRRSSHTSAFCLSYGGGRYFGEPHACGPSVLMLLFATVRRVRLPPNKQSQGERAFRHPPATLLVINSFSPCTEMPPRKEKTKKEAQPRLAAETSASKQIEIVGEEEQNHPVLLLMIPGTNHERFGLRIVIVVVVASKTKRTNRLAEDALLRLSSGFCCHTFTRTKCLKLVHFGCFVGGIGPPTCLFFLAPFVKVESPGSLGRPSPSRLRHGECRSTRISGVTVAQSARRGRVPSPWN
ncbi:hypothetical protein LX36DRAFT_404650 [Colletotrichum falcatum]|nr:hypothetical protein LX36DRAFT_404650 [Colletotrichum falcatum]